MIRLGDTVTVHAHGQPAEAGIGKVVLISGNQNSIAVVFAEKPPFIDLFNDGALLSPDGIVILALRLDTGLWEDVYTGGHYEIEVSQ